MQRYISYFHHRAIVLSCFNHLDIGLSLLCIVYHGLGSIKHAVTITKHHRGLKGISRKSPDVMPQSAFVASLFFVIVYSFITAWGSAKPRWRLRNTFV